MEIKIRYTFKTILTGEIFQYIWTIEEIESTDSFYRRYIESEDYVIIGRDLWTGNMDKNRNELYKGDFVKHMKRNEKWKPLDDDSPLEIEAISAIEYSSHGFWLSNESFGWEGEDLVNWDNLEKIGCIYTTPELIEK